MLSNVASFVFDPFTKVRLLIWCVVCASVMVIHWSLFKRGTWSNHVQETSRYGVFDLCSRRRNPVALTLTKLASMVFDLDSGDSMGRGQLKLLFLRLGEDIANWPNRVVHLLQISIVLVFCQLWRKIIFFLDGYPWLLAPAFDPLSTAEEREVALQRFLICPLILAVWMTA